MSYLGKISRAGALALTMAMAATSYVQATDLRLASYLPPEHFGTKLIINPLIAKIDEYTGGSVKVQNFPGGQLANAPGTLNAVKTGIANMGFVGVGYVGDAMPLSTVVELQGAFADLEKGHAAYWQLVQDKLLEAEFVPNKVRPVMMNLLPQTQLVLAKNREIKSLADLAGLKIRVPHSTAGDAISALGMVPVEMPVTDLYLALERGTVDGAINLTASIPSYKLNEVTEAVTTNLSMGSIGFFLVISESDWAKLTPEQQEQVTRAGAEAGTASSATFVKVNAGAEKKLAEGGMTMITIPENVIAEINEKLASVQTNWVKSVSERNAMAAEIAAAYNENLAKQ
ncbi:MAG: TRAP transporter substrate-binding protein DctP [Rhizobiaceae bacterium]